MKWIRKQGVYHCNHWRIIRQPKHFLLTRVSGQSEILKTFIGEFDRLHKAKTVAALIDHG